MSGGFCSFTMTDGKVIAGTRQGQTGKRPAGATEHGDSVSLVSCGLFRTGELVTSTLFFPETVIFS
jgi:hypothetical protein